MERSGKEYPGNPHSSPTIAVHVHAKMECRVNTIGLLTYQAAVIGC